MNDSTATSTATSNNYEQLPAGSDEPVLTIGDLPADAREALLALALDADETTAIEAVPEDLRIQAAAVIYTARHDGINGRRTYPLGDTQIYRDSWRKGSHRPWHPVPREKRECCAGLRQPSWAYHWNLYDHCRTLLHIATLFEVPDAATAIRAVLRRGLPQIGTRWMDLARAR